MKKLILSGVLSAAATVALFAQTPTTPTNQAIMLDKVTAKPGELLISYEKWRLPNGLTIFVHEDHSDPLVHVEVTYHVGSARETPGKSGFAHFFEHMMFQGSDHVADEEHFKQQHRIDRRATVVVAIEMTNFVANEFKVDVFIEFAQ